jgi:hypothetical protein
MRFRSLRTGGIQGFVMYQRELHASHGSVASARGGDEQPTPSRWQTYPADDVDWLETVLAPLGARQLIGAQCSLFDHGTPARHYILVQSGKLLVRRRGVSARSAIRFASDGDFISFDCDGVHVASCEAIVDTVVVRIDRRTLDRQARLDPMLKRLCNALHASELEFILRSLAPTTPRVAEKEPTTGMPPVMRFRVTHPMTEGVRPDMAAGIVCTDRNPGHPPMDCGPLAPREGNGAAAF